MNPLKKGHETRTGKLPFPPFPPRCVGIQSIVEPHEVFIKSLARGKGCYQLRGDWICTGPHRSIPKQYIISMAANVWFNCMYLYCFKDSLFTAYSILHKCCFSYQRMVCCTWYVLITFIYSNRRYPWCSGEKLLQHCLLHQMPIFWPVGKIVHSQSVTKQMSI